MTMLSDVTVSRVLDLINKSVRFKAVNVQDGVGLTEERAIEFIASVNTAIASYGSRVSTYSVTGQHLHITAMATHELLEALKSEGISYALLTANDSK